MNRITDKDLKAVVSRINTMCGTPSEPYAKIGDKYVPQANCYHLSGAYGGVSLHQMSSTPSCTGVRDVFSCGHITKRELYDRMQAFIVGYQTAKGE